MMEKIFISVEKSTRMVSLTKKYIGNDLENLQQELVFKFTDSFVEGESRLEYQIGGNKYHIPMTRDGESYTVPIKNVLTKEGKIPMQLVVVQVEQNEEIPVFKSNVFEMFCNKSINAQTEAPDNYKYWLDVIQTKLAEMDNLDITAERVSDGVEISITDKQGETTTEKVNDGAKGEKGEDAKINGVNTINIVAGENITIDQEDDILTINATGGSGGGNVDDVKVNGTSVVTNKVANIDLTNYVEKEDFNNSQEEQNVQIEDNSAHIDNVETLSNLFEDKTGTGTDITIEDTSDTMLKLVLSGNTYQNSTTGKNLLDFANLDNSTGTNYTFSNDIVNITNSNNTYSNVHKNILDLIKNNAGKTLKFVYDSYNFNNSGGSDVTRIVQLGITTNGSTNYPGLLTKAGISTTYKIPEDTSNITNAIFYIYANNTDTAGNYSTNITKPMLIFSDSDETPYEPYTNGASPNPDYPQDIEVVTGDNEIKIQNKNLATISNGNGLVYDKESYKNISTDTRTHSMCMIRQLYDAESIYHITGNDVDFDIPSNPTLNTTYGKTFTTYNNSKYILLKHNGISKDLFTGILCKVEPNTTYTMSIKLLKNNPTIVGGLEIANVQLEKGSTATEYIEHKEQVYPINLGNLELCKIGDYKDGFIFENGTWHKHAEIGKVILGGSEEWAYERISVGNNFYTRISDSLGKASSPIFCNRFYYYPSGNIENDYSCRISSSKNLNLRYQDYDNVDDFKEWVANNNVIVYYVLNTPTNIEITDTNLINELNAIKYALAYTGQTNILQTNDEQPFIIDYETYMKVPTKISDLINDSGFIKNTDYASSSKGGVIKVNSTYGGYIDSNGNFMTTNDSYSTYQNRNNNAIIGKGTLENVITGKNLLSTSDVKNNVVSTDTNKPLSANMGKELNDRIDSLSARGRFLSNWNMLTGLPTTNPITSGLYEYKTGDYYIVNNVGTTNYKPNGSSYTIGVASTTVESNTVMVGDTYRYDGNSWILEINTERTTTFSNISGSPMDNSNLASALNGKVGFNDYASQNTAGVSRVVRGNGVGISNDGSLFLVSAINSEIDSKSTAYKAITPSNLDYAVRSVQPVVTTLSNPSSAQALNDNSIYNILISNNIEFTLPTETIENVLHTIEIRCTISNDAIVNLGTTYFIGDEPQLTNGDWIIYYEYMNGNWYVGALDTTSGV